MGPGYGQVLEIATQPFPNFQKCYRSKCMNMCQIVTIQLTANKICGQETMVKGNVNLLVHVAVYV